MKQEDPPEKVLGVIKLENLPLFDGIWEEWEAKGEAKGRLDSLIKMLEAKKNISRV